MVIVAILIVMLLVGGAKLRHFIALGLLGTVAIVGALQMDLVEPYQVERITAFLDPNPDVRSEGYNLTQAKIAIASGGLNHGSDHSRPNWMVRVSADDDAATRI